SGAGYARDVRFPGRDLFGDEIERPYAVRRATAVPLGYDVCDVVEDDQPVGVGVRRQEFYGRLVIGAVREVHRVEHPVARDGVDEKRSRAELAVRRGGGDG